MVHTPAPHSPLPPADREAATAFWERFRQATGSTELTFSDLTFFGDSVEIAEELLELVVQGPKRATASCVADYDAEASELPAVGDKWLVCDGAGQPRVVLQTTDLRIGPLSSVDDQFAWDEGEGDRSREYWLRVHTDCFTRDYQRLGLEFHAEVPVVFERFELIYSEYGP